MKRIRSILEDRLDFTLAVNIVLLLAALFLFRPFFEENDDLSLALIAEGAFGKRSPFLIYTNIAYGWLLNVLYTIIPTIRWHCVLQYAAVFLALLAVTYMNASSRRGKGLCVVVLLCTFYELYVSLQYSKTSAFVCLCGYFLLTGDFARGKGTASKHGTAKSIAGSVLLIFGYALRQDGFLLASIFALVIFIAGLLRRLSADRSRIAALFISWVRALAPAFAVIALLYIVNGLAYGGDPGWKSFIAYNATRTELIDYRYDLLDYGAHAAELEELGISENDALLFLTWQFGDREVFTKEKMEEVLDSPFAKARAFDLTMAKAFARHLYDDVLSLNPCFLGVVIMAGFYVRSIAKKRAACPRERTADFGYGFLPLVLMLLALGFILVFYEYSGRWSHRIVYAAFTVFIYAALYEISVTDGEDMSGEEESEGEFPGILLGIVTASVIAVFLGNHFERNAFYRNEPAYQEFLSAVSKDKERLYVADTFTFQNSCKYDVFRPLREGSLDNFVLAGSWYVNSPLTDGLLSGYGYRDPYHALRTGGEGVILVDNVYADKKLLCLNEHYPDSYRLEEAGEEAGFHKYVVKKNSGTDRK